MYKNINCFSLVITLFCSASIASELESKSNTFYIGGNFGGSVIDTDSMFLTSDKNPVSATFGIVSGFNINHYLAIETDYSYLGEKPTPSGDDSVWAWSNYLLTRYDISDKADLYFKLGMSMDDSDWVPSAGVGIHYSIDHDWELDIGYRWVDDIPDVNSDLYEFIIGGRYLFGNEQETLLPPVVEPEPPQPKYRDVIVSVDAETLFDFDSYNVKANEVLNNMIKSISPVVKVTVIGHTDNVGSAAYNKKLSLRRANAVKDYMVANGVPEENITTFGYGESTPVVSNSSSDGRAKNRRVEIRYQTTEQKLE